MNQFEFMDRMQERYEKQYNRVQLEDIKKFLNQKELKDFQYQCLYDYLTTNCKFLPKIPDMSEYFDSGYRESGGSGELHPQSPFQAVVKYQDKPIDWIIDNCIKIRKMFNEDSQEVSSARISFLVYWENLVKVEPDDRQKMKQLILKNDREEIDDFLDVAIKKMPFESIILDNKFQTRRTV